jgi:hypothetical protein
MERAEEGRTESLRPEMELPERPFTATGWTATRDAIAASCTVLPSSEDDDALAGTCTDVVRWTLLRI